MEHDEDEAEAAEVWGWGAGTDGQLGTGVPEDLHSPHPIRLPLAAVGSLSPAPLLPITRIACGGAHAIALTGDGKVLTWGRNSYGQLGHSHFESCLQPKLLKSLDCLTISYVSAGWNHSGFITETGYLFTCGDGSYGQLGHGDNLSQSSPAKVSSFDSKHVVQIECGMRHSLALVKDREKILVYGFGSGRHGQLGIGLNSTNRLFSFPQLITSIADETIDSISANGDHSAAISGNGDVYIWGRAFQRKPASFLFPLKVESHMKFAQVALGWNHALLLTDDGEICILGGNHHGKLSDHCHVQAVKTANTTHDDKNQPIIPVPKKVPGLERKRIVHIAAGAEHSALVTEGGEIMTWGWGEHGQLGLGNTLDQVQPQLVKVSDALNAPPAQFKVFCGSGFTFAVKSN